jgi:capsular exopolysaccharide synthesis family protein
MRASNILLIDPARRPLIPYKPNFLMNSAIGLFGGLFAGIGIIFIREQANSIVRAPNELATQLNVPELGSIPEFRPRFGLGNPFGKPSPLRLFSGSGDERNEAGGQIRPELMTWNRKPSVFAESFRATLPSILFNGSAEGRPRVIVMTSANAGEGKTTVATNLAIAISEITRQVLIVDADIRRPRLHHLFGLDNTKGLSELLNSDEEITAARVHEYLHESDVPGLFVLTSGAEKNDSSKLFYSRRLPELIHVLRAEFDTVIIDSPPILQIPDSRLLGRFADGLIMVVRSGYTAKESAVLAYQRLAEDGSRVLGTIFNSWDSGAVHRYSYAVRK